MITEALRKSGRKEVNKDLCEEQGIYTSSKDARKEERKEAGHW